MMKTSFILIITIFLISNRAKTQCTVGTIINSQKISTTQGNFNANLSNLDFFGSSVTNIGDLNGDGINDLAVGATNDNDGGTNKGAIYILFMDIGNTVKSFQKISDTQGNFNALLNNGDFFGSSITNLGDLNSDGINELVVGAVGDDDGGFNRGAIYVLFLNIDGTIKSFQKISNTQGNFSALLNDIDLFGASLANIMDINGDNINDLVVGTPRDDDGGLNKGAIYMLFMNIDGTVKSFQKISNTQGNFSAVLSQFDQFGESCINIGDLNGDGINDLAIGAINDNDGGINKGAIYVLFMNIDGTVKSFQKISDTQGNFNALLEDNNFFGTSILPINDLDGDGINDLVVGAENDNGTGIRKGAVYILFMNRNGTTKSFQKISDGQGNFNYKLDNGDLFGTSITSLDVNGDGIGNLVVGAIGDDDGGISKGAIYILSLCKFVKKNPSIPSLSQWGIFIFGLLMLNMGLILVLKTKRL